MKVQDSPWRAWACELGGPARLRKGQTSPGATMGLMFDWKQDPHRRFNPLTREWVLVSPHRTQRPWQGQVESAAPPASPEYDPECYLCPGNSRAGGVRN